MLSAVDVPNKLCLRLWSVCRFDEECRAVVRENMEKRGVRVHLQTNPTK